MNARAPRRFPPRRARGFTLVEIMVGVVIALVAILVIYQVFAVTEGIKRNTTGSGDAQQTGLFASFALTQEIVNAGSGVATVIQELGTCPDTGNVATTLRPISVVITDGGAVDKPDSIVINYAVSSRLVVPALFTTSVAPGGNLFIQSPNGIFVGDKIVSISQTGLCESSTVTAVGAPDSAGVVQVTYTPAGAATFPSSSLLFNYGPANQAQRVLYDIATDTLRSTDLFNAAAVPVPLASNIVNLKMQYGIDTDNNSTLDTWVAATGAWAPDQILAASPEKLDQIKAVRLALVVRSEQFDRDMGDWTPPQKLFTNCGGAACPGPLDFTIPQITLANGVKGNFRYRVYENVVPIRNGIWNFQKG